MTTLIAIALAACLSTLLGGYLFLRFREGQHYWFAFAASSLVAVALLDLLPESLDLGAANGVPGRRLLMAMAASFFAYSFIDRFFLTHHVHGDEEHGHPIGLIGAGSLVLHSLLDGVAIGVAFRAGTAVGGIVATAVIVHDMTDGLNTVALMLRHRQSATRARLLLALDALAPVLGVLLGSVLHLSAAWLALLLAVFAGEFLYLGAGSLLPETQNHPTLKVMGAMAAGAGLIAALTLAVH